MRVREVLGPLRWFPEGTRRVQTGATAETRAATLAEGLGLSEWSGSLRAALDLPVANL